MRAKSMTRVGAVAVAASLVLAGEALATQSNSCSVVGTSLSCDSSATNPNVAPTAPVANTLARGATTTQTTTISSHLQNVFAPRGGAQRAAMGQTGISAGEGGQSYGLWLSGSGSAIDNDEFANEFTGSSAVGTLGFDVQPSDNLVLGVSLFTELTDLSTQYNLGEVDREGYSLVPYVAYSFGQGTSVDAMVGVTYLTADVSRGGGVATGDYTGHRVMTALNAHHSVPMGAINLRGDLGYVYAREKQGNYTESGTNLAVGERTTNLAQGKIGGRLGYGMAQIEPYVQAHYVRDFVRNSLSGVAGGAQTPKNDNDEVLTAIGLDWFPTATESVGLEASYGFLRENESVGTLLFNGRIRF